VISADARQLYRGLDIGTAKPDAVTLARVPHRGWICSIRRALQRGAIRS